MKDKKYRVDFKSTLSGRRDGYVTMGWYANRWELVKALWFLHATGGMGKPWRVAVNAPMDEMDLRNDH